MGNWELSLEYTQGTQPPTQGGNFSWLPEVELARKKAYGLLLVSNG